MVTWMVSGQPLSPMLPSQVSNVPFPFPYWRSYMNVCNSLLFLINLAWCVVGSYVPVCSSHMLLLESIWIWDKGTYMNIELVFPRFNLIIDLRMFWIQNAVFTILIFTVTFGLFFMSVFLLFLEYNQLVCIYTQFDIRTKSLINWVVASVRVFLKMIRK